MKNTRKTFSIILSIISCAVILSSCSRTLDIKPDDKDDVEFATQTKDTVLEYNLLVNREITVFTNQLNTRMSILRTMKKDTSNTVLENERKNAAHAKELLEESLNSFSTARPPVEYEDERENTVRIMGEVIKHFDDYIKTLKDGGDYNKYNEIFEADFISITGEASLYNQ